MAKYLYNDVELPALPASWDKDAYPYAILYNLVGNKMFIAFAQRPAVSDGKIVNPYDAPIPAFCDHTSSDINYWYNSYETEFTVDSYTLLPFWANYDVLNEDGSVYLSSSYPINKETGEEIHDYEIGGEPEEPDIPDPDEPTPQDFYVVKSGVGQKHYAYVRVGSQLVKQDEYLI